MKRRLFALPVLIIMFFPVESAFAQNDTCEELIAAAMQSTDLQCAEMGDNQACYGHALVQAFEQPSTLSLSFSEPGDVVDLIKLKTLRVSPLDVNADHWGIALMQLLAQAPNAVSEEVSLLVFGSVELSSVESSPGVQLWVEIQGADVNVYESPSPSSPSLLDVWFGQMLLANGRLSDDSWFRVELPGTGSQGWVIADSVKSSDDLTALPVIDPQTPQFGPLRAFQLQTGLESGSACEDAPPDGLLVQTPEGVAEVTFLINEVNIQLRATAFLQAQAGHEMVIAVLDGHATVKAQGVTQDIPAGMMTTIPLDNNLTPSWPPSPPVPYQGQVAVPALQPLSELIASNAEPVGTTGQNQQTNPVSAPPAVVQPTAPPPTQQPAPPAPSAPDQNTQDSGSSGGGDSSSGPPGGGGAPPGSGGAPG